MRLTELQRQLAALLVLLKEGCKNEYCVIHPWPNFSGRDKKLDAPRVCLCTPPDIAMRLRALARAIKGYQWDEEE